jgi:hypothetical protein
LLKLYSLFLLPQEAQKKKLCKKKMPFFRSSRWASAFKKAEQNNRLGL